MNKQEALKQIEQQKEAILQMQSWAFYGYIEGLVKQLDEPQTIELPKMKFENSRKVQVPQFVADWYEDVVDEFYTVLERLVLNYRNNTDMPICKWFFETEDALKILINMHQFGYTVVKDQRYTVKMTATKQQLFYNNLDKRLFFSLGELATQFTRKQLEDAGFGEVFDSPLFEVEEVEE